MRFFGISLVAMAGLFAGLVLPSGAGGLAAALGQPLDLETRAAYQLAVEAVYWRHRDWPEANPAARPALEALLPADLLEAKAAEAVRKSAALERFWGRPITGAQLQAEIERMARASKQPERLAELWAALGNDPALIAEILARPLLADRLIREWYAHDERFHGALEARAREDLRQASTSDALPWMSGGYAEREWVKRDALAPTRDAASPSFALHAQAWDAQLESLARRFDGDVETLRAGAVSRLHEDANRFYVLAVLERGDDRLRVATVEWRKPPFESWWAGVQADLPSELESPAYAYRLPELAGGDCVDDTWRPTLAVPDPRYEHTAVWTGSEMIVWGGDSSVGTFPEEGGRYDPATDSWVLLSKVNAPRVRAAHTAVWTGTEMIVWGGFGDDPGRTGGRYDPLTDTWRPTNDSSAPSPRADHVAVWTGSEMIVWGGGGNLNSGGRYDPVFDTWQATSTAGAPQGRDLAAAVWTGEELIVWGGFRNPFTLDTGGRYDPATDSWQPTSLVNVPSFRHFHTGVWTGEEMIVWGGVGEGFGTSTGGRYDPDTDTWQPTSVVGAPSPRWLQEAIWTGSEMIIWGGTILLADHPVTGGRYDPVSDTWTPTSTVNVPEGREDAASVWTGTEMIVWGGLGDEWFVSTGGRYDPANDTWLPTQTYNVPTARGLHTAVWTGAEMMIYGGDLLDEPGGLYDPATDTWRVASELDAPRGIQNMTSVWTGNEVIVWGGFPETDRGGRYDPVSDTWQPTSQVNAPTRRYWHTAVWTGSEMIIWGGWPGVNTGGRYDPSTDTWSPTSLVNAPSPRDSHVGVWTGSEMVVWGGYPESVVGRTGGRYDPATDSWRRTRPQGAPARRSNASVVWTGTEMIVWGGQSIQDFESYSSGGRYSPATNTWQPTAISGAPSARVTPAVWSGDEMLVWGGDLLAPTGGRYNPLSNAWRPTSQAGAPNGRWNTTLVWTGSEMIAWGGIIQTATGGLYCARLEGNQRPIARPDRYSTEVDVPVNVSAPGVLANDTDGNGDPLRAFRIGGPANGSLNLNPNGAFDYTPNAGFAGVDIFSYRAYDGQAPSNLGRVSISVACTTDCLRSTLIIIDILLDSTRSRMFVETETGAPAASAVVSATWTLPNGSDVPQQATTDAGGQAVFSVPDDSSGTFRITITNIEKPGFTFDPVNSVLTHAATR